MTRTFHHGLLPVSGRSESALASHWVKSEDETGEVLGGRWGGLVACAAALVFGGGCADEPAFGPPLGEIDRRSVALGVDGSALDDGGETDVGAALSPAARAEQGTELADGEVAVISGIEALRAHAARQAALNPEWGALLKVADRPLPEVVNIDDVSAAMASREASRRPNLPPGLNCSHPDVVTAEARFVAHVSDADVESAPTTPVERDLRHSLARREARKVDRESVAEFIAGAQATCERLAPEQAGECRSRVDRAAAALLAY